jgi:hypothetical protein
MAEIILMNCKDDCRWERIWNETLCRYMSVETEENHKKKTHLQSIQFCGIGLNRVHRVAEIAVNNDKQRYAKQT